MKLQKKEIIYTIFLSVVFIYTRLIRLDLWPIFTDEAIYTRWSQIALHDASLRFIPLTDGKQPLWHWVTMVIMKIFEDPLIAGRVVSAISGLVACIGIWFLTYELFKKKSVAFLSSLIYCAVPFFLLYDRMAIVDSMLTMWVIWALYFALKTTSTLRLDYAMITGFVIGAVLLKKSPAIFLIYLYPLNLLFLAKKEKFLRWLWFTVPL